MALVPEARRRRPTVVDNPRGQGGDRPREPAGHRRRAAGSSATAASDGVPRRLLVGHRRVVDPVRGRGAGVRLVPRGAARHVPASGDGNGFATRYAEDFALYAEHGLTHHRLSIEWARIEPEEGRRDPAAIEHYRAVLTAARDAGVAPWVCLHHFTLPGWFTEIGDGAFCDDRARSYHWARHVAFCAETFGDLVFGWKPINEPFGYVALELPARRAAAPAAELRPDARRVPRHPARAARRLARAARRRHPGRHDPQPLAALPRRRLRARRAQHPRHRRADVGRVDAGRPRRRARAARPRPPRRSPTCASAATWSGSPTTRRTRSAATAASRPTRAARGSARWATRRGARDSASCSGGCTTSCRDARCWSASTAWAPTTTSGGATSCASRSPSTAEAIDDGVDLRGFFLWTGVDNYEWTFGYDVAFGLFDRDRQARPSAELAASYAGR